MFKNKGAICSKNMVPCENGKCVHFIAECNGNDGCGNNIDESADCLGKVAMLYPIIAVLPRFSDYQLK